LLSVTQILNNKLHEILIWTGYHRFIKHISNASLLQSKEEFSKLFRCLDSFSWRNVDMLQENPPIPT